MKAAPKAKRWTVRVMLYSLVAAVCATLLFGVTPAKAQQLTSGATTIALKSGEKANLGPLYWVSHCRSILNGLPGVEILEGPPELTAEVEKAMVLPRNQSCPNKVAGGMLFVSAKDINDPSVSRVTLRITYPTKDGDRQLSRVINVALMP